MGAWTTQVTCIVVTVLAQLHAHRAQGVCMHLTSTGWPHVAAGSRNGRSSHGESIAVRCRIDAGLIGSRRTAPRGLLG